MRIAAVSIIMGAQLLATPAWGRERLLTPTDEWKVQAQDEYCSLTRNFADPEGETVRLQLQRFGPGEWLKITMVGDGLPLGERRRGVATFKIRFKPDPEWRHVGGTTGYVGELDALTFSTNLATSREAERMQRAYETGGELEGWSDYLSGRAAEVNQLALSYPSRDDTVLQLGSMTEPFRQLNNCAGGLLARWGYDSSVLGTQRRPPRLTNSAEIATAVLDAMRRAKAGHNDAIHVRMDVDEQGRAAGCTVQQPRRGNEIEALICNTIRDTARFEPAIGADGAPMRVPYVTSVAFGIR